MVKHSPNERLRLYQLQQQQQQQQQHQAMATNQEQVTADVHALPNTGNAPPALESAGNVQPPDTAAAAGTGANTDNLPPVSEALRRAAELRALADEQDKHKTGFTPHPNVNTRRRRVHPDDIQLDEDFGDGVEDLSGSYVGEDFPDDPPPWLSGIINAAVTAAATAVAALPQRASAAPPRSSMAPTKLSDRKVPDFWESKPEEWFRIFDAHLTFFNPSEEACFNTLLTLLTPAALSKMTPILRVPGRDPYTRAKATLLKHFAKTPRDLARELRELRSLGDNTPSEILAHIRGLLPDPDVFFEVVLLDLLPSNARDAALQHSSLDAMAAAADLIVAENAVAAASPAIAAMSLDDAGHRSPEVAAVSTPPADLCPVHARYGKAAYRCSDPRICRMKNIVEVPLTCLLYTSPSPRDLSTSRMPSSA